MKERPRIFLALLILLAFASVADARSKKKNESPKPAVTVIASVSADSITIATGAVSKTYAITQFTEILVKGQRSTLAALQPGMAVSVAAGSDATKASRINASDPPVALPAR